MAAIKIVALVPLFSALCKALASNRQLILILQAGWEDELKVFKFAEYYPSEPGKKAPLSLYLEARKQTLGRRCRCYFRIKDRVLRSRWEDEHCCYNK